MKRKKSTLTAETGSTKTIRRSLSVDDQIDFSQQSQLTQQSPNRSPSNDSSDWEDQEDHKSCGVCSGSLISGPINDDDPMEQIFCEFCGGGSHLKCLRVENVIDGHLKDLISLIGWRCSKCKLSLKQRLQKLENTVTSLKCEITKLKTANTNITKEFSLLNSTLKSHQNKVAINQHIDDPVSFKPKITVADPAQLDQSKPVPSYAQVVENPPNSLSIENIMKAIHLDTMSRDRKKNNIVVSGFKSTKADELKDQTSQFLNHYWNVPLTTKISCRRLGEERSGKVRPLLISLPDSQTVDGILKHARVLRQSQDPYVKDNVFVNPDRTKAEALAAFELRQQRRKAKTGNALNTQTAPLNPQAPTYTPAGSNPPSSSSLAASTPPASTSAPTPSTSKGSST